MKIQCAATKTQHSQINNLFFFLKKIYKCTKRDLKEKNPSGPLRCLKIVKIENKTVKTLSWDYWSKHLYILLKNPAQFSALPKNYYLILLICQKTIPPLRQTKGSFLSNQKVLPYLKAKADRSSQRGFLTSLQQKPASQFTWPAPRAFCWIHLFNLVHFSPLHITRPLSFLYILNSEPWIINIIKSTTKGYV